MHSFHVSSAEICSCNSGYSGVHFTIINIFCITVPEYTISHIPGIAQDDRVIDETPLTVKVISGSTAILPCSVDPKYTEGYADQYSVRNVSHYQTQ